MSRIASLGITLVFQLAAADPRFGTWKLVSAQSAMDPPRKLTVTSQRDSVHVLISGSSPIEFTAKWDGRNYPVPNQAAFNQIAVRRLSKGRTELIQKKDGAVVATVHDQLSADGRELTAITVRKGHPNEISIWERTGGAMDPENPFAGEWTEDLSKSRMRQGVVLKIGPDGGGGVLFAGDFRYDAKLDGKDYNVTNSRDDTVALKLVDAHTVESIYKRDEQIGDRDRWVVSTDGQRLTVNTMGTLETGEHIREDLVFRKQ
jgi:hypothetical protein